MRYGGVSFASAYGAKLLGTYEQELHPVFAEVIRRRFPTVVDIGAAEGYYAVGFARLGSSVVAFEMEAEGRRLLADMAELNGVRDRIRLSGRCAPEDLCALLDGLSGPVFLLCDVEGFEKALLDPVAVPGLARCHLLVELHEFIEPGVTRLLRERFADTHRVVEIPALARVAGDFPLAAWWTRLVPDRWLAATMAEHRSGVMSWLWLQPPDA